jgi:cyclase
VLKRRIVPCLDVRDGRVVKGVNFEELRDAGDPAELGRLYARQGADELVFLDITATRRDERTAVRLAEAVARRLFIPFTIGGGLRDVHQMREVLHAGADKVGINTAAAARPELISEAAERFGSQAVVVAIDAYREMAGPSESTRWGVRVRAGTEDTRLDAVAWSEEVARLGAGEILLTSIDRDGTKRGFDLELLRAVCGAVSIPVIASGGAGSATHFAEAFEAGASAALAASLFHFRELEISTLKRELADLGVPVRPAPEEVPDGGTH